MQGRKNKRKIGRYLGVLVLLGGVVFTMWVILHFQSDLRAARQRVSAGGQLDKTDCGMIEYAERGEWTSCVSDPRRWRWV